MSAGIQADWPDGRLNWVNEREADMDLPSQIRTGPELRRLADPGGLFESIGQFDQERLLPGFAYEGEANRQAEDIAGRYGNVGISGYGGHGGAFHVPINGVAIDQIDQPGRSAAGNADGIQAMFRQHEAQALLARQKMVLRECTQVGRASQRPLCLG